MSCDTLCIARAFGCDSHFSDERALRCEDFFIENKKEFIRCIIVCERETETKGRVLKVLANIVVLDTVHMIQDCTEFLAAKKSRVESANVAFESDNESYDELGFSVL